MEVSAHESVSKLPSVTEIAIEFVSQAGQNGPLEAQESRKKKVLTGAMRLLIFIKKSDEICQWATAVAPVFVAVVALPLSTPSMVPNWPLTGPIVTILTDTIGQLAQLECVSL